MQLSKEGRHVDWGTGWHSDLFLHKHSTSVRSALGSEHPGSFEHSDFHQQESVNCWSIEWLDASEEKTLIQLTAVLAETTAEQDKTQVQLKVAQHVV
jgi:hypothetical protein